jgi:hypothetical protein
VSGAAFFRANPDDEQRIPGGCDDCDAYQTFDRSQAPIYRLLVHHNPTCPWLRQHEKSAS